MGCRIFYEFCFDEMKSLDLILSLDLPRGTRVDFKNDYELMRKNLSRRKFKILESNLLSHEIPGSVLIGCDGLTFENIENIEKIVSESASGLPYEFSGRAFKLHS